MAIKLPSAESVAHILVPEFKGMKFIKYCSKEAVDEYLDNVKNKLDKVE